MRLLAILALAVAAAGAVSGQQSFNQYQSNLYWASGAADPRVLMLGPGARLWVGSGDGTVRILEDNDHNGVVDNVRLFVAGVFSPHGLAWRPAGAGYEIFVAHLTSAFGGTGQITRFIDADGDDVFESVVFVVLNLPSGAHQVNNIELDPSGQWLYLAQGAQSDSVPGGGAVVARVSPQAQNLLWGSPQVQVVATGMRNAWGIEFHPSGELFATENGRDDQGPAQPPEEFNRVVLGRDYGFPAVSGMPPAGHPSEPPVGLFETHTSANGFAFDTGSLLTGFEGQVFVAEWGSWPGITPSPVGRKIVQGNLHQRANGSWELASWDFLAGCGHPLDVEIGPAGELFFSVQWGVPGWPEGIHRVVPAHGIALRLQGVPEPGQPIQVTVRSPSRPGHVYQVAASAGTGPLPTALGDLGLSWDDLFVLSLTPNPWLVFAPWNTLDANGVSAGANVVNLPPLPALQGFVLYLAAVTVDPLSGQLSSISPTARLRIL